jgi:hypothetical protein
MTGRPYIDTSWHWRAACNHDKHPEVRPEWFAPLDYSPPGKAEDEPSVQRALAVCAHCPMIFECDEQRRKETGARGVWAGKYWSSTAS